MSQQRKKKTVEYHFVDMNDPDRYKKLKVTRACDFCRKRKSKCDLGVPGSGTCSNCKKSNQTCIFSPVNPPKPQKTIKTHSFQPHDPLLPTPTHINYHPFFSLDPQGHCGYEKHTTITYNHPSLHAALHDMPSYSKHLEQEMFDVYFCYVHPYYPVLDRYSIMQALRYDSNAIPLSLKLAVISIAFHFTPRYQNSESLANAYYQHACMQLDYKPTLMTLQTLFLLYKYQELLTPVGMPLTTVALDYLKQIQTMIPQLQQQLKENTATWAIQDEFLCRTGWILLIILSMINPSDERRSELIQYCNTPSRLPILTETEHYDKVELNTTCSLIHFINLTLLYSRAIGFISDQGSLFTSKECPELIKLAQDLDIWKSTVPQSISSMLAPFDATNQSASFNHYLCLIYDILDLLLSIHQQTDMVAKSIQLCKRTFHFCAHDTHRSRLASIQGSRLISYGLTLSLQSLTYCRLEQQDQQKKAFYYYCSLIFQTFDVLTLLPNLQMSLQTLKTQIEAREKLSTVEKGFLYTTHARFDQFSSSGSSSSSSSGGGGGGSGGTHSGKSSDYFSPVHPQDSSSSPYYHTRTTNTEQQSWPHHTHHQSYSHHYYDPPMPTTPIFEEDVGMSSVDYHHDPLTPPITFLSVDSYFQLPQPASRDTLIAIQEPPHVFPLVIEASKSCKHKRLF